MKKKKPVWIPKMCGCGRPAVRKKCGSGVCACCDQIETEVTDKNYGLKGVNLHHADK